MTSSTSVADRRQLEAHPRGPSARSAGLALLGAGGALLMFGSIAPLGTLSSNSWCAATEPSCYGAYSPNWLGLGNDSQAPQLGDWASSQGLVFIGLGVLTLTLAIALSRGSSQSDRETRRVGVLTLFTTLVAALLVVPQLTGGPAWWPYSATLVTALAILGVLWGRTVLSGMADRTLVRGLLCTVATIAVAAPLCWRSFHDFLTGWVTPHNIGWQSFAYSWLVFLVPMGAVLVILGLVLVIVAVRRRSLSHPDSPVERFRRTSAR